MKEHLTNIKTGEDTKRGGDTISNHPDRDYLCKKLSAIFQQNESHKGEKNSRFGDHRTYEELHGKEKAEKLKQTITKAVSGDNNYQTKMTSEQLKAKSWNNRYDAETLETIYSKHRGENSPAYKAKYKEWIETSKNFDPSMKSKLIEIFLAEKTFKVSFIAKVFNLNKIQTRAILGESRISITKDRLRGYNRISNIEQIREKYGINY